MKFVLLISCCLSILVFSCKKSKPSNIQLKRGLVAYYPFNGNTNDESGSNLNGSVVGGTLTVDRSGNNNRAFNFNGNGERIIVTNNGKIAFDTAFTISFNVLIRDFRRHHFVVMADNNTATALSFGVGTNLPGNKNLNFGVIHNNVPCNTFTPNQSQMTNVTQYILQPEIWYQIVAVFRHGLVKTYVNGVLNAAFQNQASHSVRICSEAELIIGGWWAQDPEASMNGKLDEVRLYNRELNMDEIAELAKGF